VADCSWLICVPQMREALSPDSAVERRSHEDARAPITGAAPRAPAFDAPREVSAALPCNVLVALMCFSSRSLRPC
jgi:hypothetical protein